MASNIKTLLVWKKGTKKNQKKNHEKRKYISLLPFGLIKKLTWNSNKWKKKDINLYLLKDYKLIDTPLLYKGKEWELRVEHGRSRFIFGIYCFLLN